MERLGRETILSALIALNERLCKRGITGDICIYGGGTMVLAFNARPSTKDLDAVFQPAEIIRQAAAEVAVENGLQKNWINDGVKGWVSATEHLVAENMPQFSNLRLTRPTKKYLLAMKCLAARTAGFDTQGDKEDIIYLVRALDLHSAQSILKIVEEFYPEDRIQPKTRFLIEEIMSEIGSPG